MEKCMETKYSSDLLTKPPLSASSQTFLTFTAVLFTCTPTLVQSLSVRGKLCLGLRFPKARAELAQPSNAKHTNKPLWTP